MAFTPSRKPRDPSRIGEFLERFFREKAPVFQSEESLVLDAWGEVVGPEVRRKSAARAFRNGILFVETNHPIWVSELSARRHLLQRKINSMLGKEAVREIRLRQALPGRF